MRDEHRHRVPHPHEDAARDREALVEKGLLKRLRFPDGHVAYRARTHDDA